MQGTPPAGTGEETRQIQRIALLAFLLNLGLAAMKGVLAATSESLAVTASAIDSGTDCIASVALYAGLRLSIRKTPSFPLGLYKIENVISVTVALFIFLAGYEIAREAFTPHSRTPDISLSVVLLMALGTVATQLFGWYALRAGRRTASPTLRAEGRHRQVDALSSGLVLVSVTLGYAGFQVDLFGISLDQAAAVLVLAFIAYTGWQLLSDGMRVLLDASVDPQTLLDVQRIIEREPMVAEVQSLVGRNAGRFRFLQATVSLRTDDLQKAHRIGRHIEQQVREHVPRVERISLHYEPQRRTHVHIAVPLANRSGDLSEHFGEAPYFALVVVRLSDRSVESEEIEENPCTRMERGKGICVAEWLVGRNVDEILLKGEIKHRGPGYVFSDAGISTREIREDHLRKALAARLAEKS
ncbi:MAG: cation diffusion facilitator family transporter [Deltaproteobacteria bacterium]|nr:cation diffusion facilitator family transporter [Deltaproteobacteria bacterium]